MRPGDGRIARGREAREQQSLALRRWLLFFCGSPDARRPNRTRSISVMLPARSCAGAARSYTDRMNSHFPLPLDKDLDDRCAICGHGWRAGEEVIYRSGELRHGDCALACERRRRRDRERFLRLLARKASHPSLRVEVARLVEDCRSGWSREQQRQWSELAAKRVATLMAAQGSQAGGSRWPRHFVPKLAKVELSRSPRPTELH